MDRFRSLPLSNAEVVVIVMLTHEENEALTRVGPGTAMGNLMRQYWLPFLGSDMVEKDGQPHRVRLLGEDLVAFRDTQGQVGLVDHACPHRGAPMIFGRNQGQGLACIYHGWKFDVSGRCQDMSNLIWSHKPIRF